MYIHIHPVFIWDKETEHSVGIFSTLADVCNHFLLVQFLMFLHQNQHVEAWLVS